MLLSMEIITILIYFCNKNLVELTATDGFFTWGWSNTSKNIIQGFNFKSNNRRKIYNTKGVDYLLFVNLKKIVGIL